MSTVVSACVALAGFAGAAGISYFVAQAPVEGQDYVTQCASDVLANNQSLLDIPWEIDKDRDVGYVGGLPIASWAETEFKAGTLNTGRELQGFPPEIVIGQVVIKGSQQPAQPKSDWRMGAVGGKIIKHLTGVVNPTADLTVWQWQRNKWFGLKKELVHWQKRGSGAKLMVVHSSGDILYGGCSESEIHEKYQAITSAAGPAVKLIFAAEISPNPIDLGWKYEQRTWPTERMTNATGNMTGGAGWIEGYADCTNETVGACNSPPRYQFANGGFIMGPVDEIYKMFESPDDPANGLESYTAYENRLINDYYLKHSEWVTLDYAGVLAMSLNNMAGTANDLPIQVSAADSQARIYHKAFPNQTVKVCFIHGNGNAFEKLKYLAEEEMTI